MLAPVRQGWLEFGSRVLLADCDLALAHYICNCGCSKPPSQSTWRGAASHTRPPFTVSGPVVVRRRNGRALVTGVRKALALATLAKQRRPIAGRCRSSCCPARAPGRRVIRLQLGRGHRIAAPRLHGGDLPYCYASPCSSDGFAKWNCRPNVMATQRADVPSWPRACQNPCDRLD